MIVVPIISGLIGVGAHRRQQPCRPGGHEDLRNAVYDIGRPTPWLLQLEDPHRRDRELYPDHVGVQLVVTDTASSVFADLTIVVTDAAGDGARIGA